MSWGNAPLTGSKLTQISDAIWHYWAAMKLLWLPFTLWSFVQIHETNLWHPCYHYKQESLMILGMWGYRRKYMSMKLQQHNYHIYICCCQIGLCARISLFSASSLPVLHNNRLTSGTHLWRDLQGSLKMEDVFLSIMNAESHSWCELVKNGKPIESIFLHW